MIAWPIVATTILVASRTFVAVAFQCSVGRVTIIVTAIVVNATLAGALISAVNNIALSIVAKCELVLGAMGATAIRSIVECAAELLRRFAKEAFADTIRFLVLNHSVEFFPACREPEKRS